MPWVMSTAVSGTTINCVRPRLSAMSEARKKLNAIATGTMKMNSRSPPIGALSSDGNVLETDQKLKISGILIILAGNHALSPLTRRMNAMTANPPQNILLRKIGPKLPLSWSISELANSAMG